MIERIFDWFYLPLQPFVWEPLRIAGVSLAFAIGCVLLSRLSWTRSRTRAWPLLIVALAWALFACWEWHCKIGKYNIRVDLLLFWPHLAALTIGCLLATLRWRQLVRR